MKTILLGTLAVAMSTLAAATPVLASGRPATARSNSVIREGSARTPDGVRIYYRVVGRGGPVVLAPFALYHGSSLDSLAVGRRIVTYDPRGRGRSQAVSPDRVSLDLLLTDLDTVRRAVGAEQVSIIGWSGAGMETFVYALRNPQRVSRLVQLAPVAPRIIPYGDQMIADRQRRTDQAASSLHQQRVAAGDFAANPSAECRARVAISQPALLADPRRHLPIPDVCIYPNEYSATIGAYFGGLFRSIAGYDWRSSLPLVRIPRLVIHPLEDNIPLAGNREWVVGQPEARLLTVANSGHFPQYEQANETLGAIEEFLSGRWPSRAVTLP